MFHKQADHYVQTRPTYPDNLFKFISSNTPVHHLVWDVGTGSGQAAKALAEIYKNVVGTDTSQKQLDHAPNLPNVRYQCTPPIMSDQELHRLIAGPSTVDLVTIAQALHWFDLPTFYHQVKLVLKKPHGVVAAWCYTIPKVNDTVDSIFTQFYKVDSDPYWDPARKLVDDEYRTIDFPFEAVEGVDGTGPFEFRTERVMDLDGFFTYIRSWSAYQTAKEKGVELLSEDVVDNFRRAWDEDGQDKKVVISPVFLRIGKVGSGINE